MFRGWMGHFLRASPTSPIFDSCPRRIVSHLEANDVWIWIVEIYSFYFSSHALIGRWAGWARWPGGFPTLGSWARSLTCTEQLNAFNLGRKDRWEELEFDDLMPSSHFVSYISQLSLSGPISDGISNLIDLTELCDHSEAYSRFYRRFTLISNCASV